MRKNSFITVTDQFCGAGGSSLGAAAAGAEIRLAMNHWKLAVETHNTNFPDTAHDCTDISVCDPRRYPSTDILITSPECTNHSLAKGAMRRNQSQLKLWDNKAPDPAEERSRATMWDVPRFAEYHDYRAVIVENVVDARHWRLWDAWLQAMHLLGYEHEIVYTNSMFHWPTPQSRDRMYVVFWKGIPKPDLSYRPQCYCAACEKDVQGVQSWKNQQRRWGRYGARNQYLYCCPDCAAVVDPYYYPAATAIDWSLPGERIRDRARPLKPRTMERIRYGLEKFGKQALTVQLDYTHSESNRAWPVDKPLTTQTSRQVMAVVAPFLIQYYTRHYGQAVSAIDAPLPGVNTEPRHALIQPPSAYHSVIDEALPTLTTQVREGMVVPPFLIKYFGGKAYETHSVGVDEPLGSVTTADHHGLIMPFLTSYYGNGGENARPITEAMGTLSTHDRHALVDAPSIDPEDCFFRMLHPGEIKKAMAFPDTYVVLGNSRDQVKQCGNAVTPPVMNTIAGQVMAALA